MTLMKRREFITLWTGRDAAHGTRATLSWLTNISGPDPRGFRRDNPVVAAFDLPKPPVGEIAVLAGQISRLRAGLVLAQYRDNLLLGEPDPLHRTVKFMFQPAEEGPSVYAARRQRFGNQLVP
jgi:hypothetical protein